MQLTKEMHGARVRCKIRDEQIDDARISIDQDGEIYICQDRRDGRVCEDSLGYKYSWYVGDGSEADMDFNDVTDFVFLSNEVRNAQKGDIIVRNGEYYMKVFERFGDILFVGYGDWTPEDATVEIGLSRTNTWMELVDCGYTIYQFADGTKPGDYEKEEKESLELTIDQIAEKFGVDPKKVKIKKGDDAISGEGL